VRGLDGQLTYSSIVVALPQFVFTQIQASRKTYQAEQVSRLYNPVYWRPLTLLQVKHNGLVNALLDKYKYWCSFPGSKNTIGDIRELYPHLYELEKGYDVNALTSRLLQALLEKPFALAAHKVSTSAYRNRTRVKAMYALLEPGLMVQITCDSDNFENAKLSHLAYQIIVVCLSKQAGAKVDVLLRENQTHRMLRPDNDNTLLERQYDQNEAFLSQLIAKPILA
jgi:hypothetical protein